MDRSRALQLKRIIDVIGSIAGLLLLFPVLAAAAIAVFVTMGRPVFFCQERAGLRGKPFRMYKLRTMRAPRAGETMFRTDAQRVTPVGRVLRRTSIDELPELWMVLLGQMSLVGPRPLLTEYLPRYTREQARRHEMRPGLTGWAAVHGRQHLPFSRR